jgi:hypothetical protein
MLLYKHHVTAAYAAAAAHFLAHIQACRALKAQQRWAVTGTPLPDHVTVASVAAAAAAAPAAHFLAHI